MSETKSSGDTAQFQKRCNVTLTHQRTSFHLSSEGGVCLRRRLLEIQAISE